MPWFLPLVRVEHGATVTYTRQENINAAQLPLTLQKPLTQTEMVRVMDNCDPEWSLEGSPKSKLIFTRDEVDAALSAGELIPYYQPKILVRQKKLSGFEALVRWAHPKYGILPPAMFVHHIEEGELAFRFFYTFLDLVCAAMTRILVHAPDTHCSVNLPVPLLDDTNIVDEMTRIVHEHKLNSHSIVLEVTETSVMSNLSAALGTLARLRLNGFGLAMDDYGTGYSSIKQLSRIPFTELKIDREFVADAANSPKKLAILSSAIAMCQRLQILSVAEGVETEVDWQQLVTLGCDLSQGYYHSRPLSEDMLLKWIAENSVV
jgi:EAL domain-containing protein (putative c-di-GMP-specific phosphodiesterase class I)